MKKLFVNQNAVSFELDNLNKTKAAAAKFLAWANDMELELDSSTLKEVMTGNVSTFVEAFRAQEQMKIDAFHAQFGKLATFGDSITKLKAAELEYRLKLRNSLPSFPYELSFYVNYLEYDNGVLSIWADAEKEIEQKHSVSVDEKKLEKHSRACNLLNDLFDHPENEFERFLELFYFNPETKELEVNISAYSNLDSKFIENRLADIENNKRIEFMVRRDEKN